MALSPDQLNDTDERVLDVMRDGRVTPQHVADKLDLSRPYASDRLKRLVEHGHVRKLAAGLYELVDDPRDDTAIEYAAKVSDLSEDELLERQLEDPSERDTDDTPDLRARLQNALEARDDQRAKADRLEEELQDCREQLEDARAAEGAAPEVPDLGRAREGVSAAAGRVSEALDELPQQEALIQPKLEAAQSELEAVNEALEDE